MHKQTLLKLRSHYKLRGARKVMPRHKGAIVVHFGNSCLTMLGLSNTSAKSKLLSYRDLMLHDVVQSCRQYMQVLSCLFGSLNAALHVSS